MTRDLPPLTWLRAFEAAARTLSFTDAARELNLTQAAVSKHVRALEAHLRQPLFRRGARSLDLTRSGEAYFPKVQDALERLTLGTREVFGPPRRSGPLTLRCGVSLALAWLAPRLPEFLARHPGIDLRLLTSVWSDADPAEGVDLDLRYGPIDAADPSRRRLTRERLTPLCAPDVARRLRHPADLARERLLHVLGYQEGWGIWLSAAGAGGVDAGKGLQLDTSALAFDLAARGVGIALGRTSLARPHRAEGRLVAPFALEVPVNEGFYLTAGAAPPHPRAVILADWLMEQAETDPS
jgi:LysR family transcriptional regulator, glycine cleavage system transcriptional activator